MAVEWIAVAVEWIAVAVESIQCPVVTSIDPSTSSAGSGIPPVPRSDRPAPEVLVHRARATDVRRIKELVDIYAGAILLEKTLANLYEDVTEFWVAEVDGIVMACGALHVLWEDLGEIRTVATDPKARSRGLGRA
ncbi:MAG: amino-acid N-acetyltransferase, partial [Frankiaceae bacterium]|nr:amino-acid N-acetyltransferase [Frankiaceae bacterium]